MNAKRISIAVAMSLAAAAWAGCSSNTGTLQDPGSGAPGGGSPDGLGLGAGGGGNAAGPGNGNQSAKEVFVTKVYPSLLTGQTAGPQCTACHVNGEQAAPKFLAASGEASYSAIELTGLIAAPSNSLLLLHGAHTGPALAPQQQAIVTDWLTQEAAARGLTGGSGSPTQVVTLDSSLREFGSCMDINEWNAQGLDQLYRIQTNAGNGNPSCMDCHNQGDGGNWMAGGNATLATKAFQMNQGFPFIKRMVSGTVDANGGFKALVASNRWRDKGVEAKLCNRATTNCHPRYTLTAAQQTGIDNFVASTLARAAAHTCGGDAGHD